MKPLNSRQKWPFFVLAGLLLLGLGASGALVWHHENLVNGSGEAHLSFCTEGRVFNCDVVNASSFSEIAGIPTALLALPTYLLVILLLIFGRKTAGSALIISGIGLLASLFSLYLAGVSYFVLKAFCLWCSLLYVVNLGMCILPWLANPGGMSFSGLSKKTAWRAAGAYALLLGMAWGGHRFYRESVMQRAQVYRLRESAQIASNRWIGKCAPSFALPDLASPETMKFDFNQKREKPLLLVFWNVRCGHCRAELPVLNNYHQTRKDQFEIVTLTRIQPDELLSQPNRLTETFDFMKEQGMDWKVLNDTKGLSSVLQVQATPTSILIAPSGRISAYWKGAIPQLDQVFDETLRNIASQGESSCEIIPGLSAAGLIE